MTSDAEPRRSTRSKRQTTFPEPDSSSPAVKRVKVDSSSTTILNETPQGLCENIATLISTKAPLTALSGNSIASANNPSSNLAGTRAGTKKPLPFGNPPAWSEVSDSLLTGASVIG